MRSQGPARRARNRPEEAKASVELAGTKGDVLARAHKYDTSYDAQDDIDAGVAAWFVAGWVRGADRLTGCSSVHSDGKRFFAFSWRRSLVAVLALPAPWRGHQVRLQPAPPASRIACVPHRLPTPILRIATPARPPHAPSGGMEADGAAQGSWRAHPPPPPAAPSAPRSHIMVMPVSAMGGAARVICARYPPHCSPPLPSMASQAKEGGCDGRSMGVTW